MNILQEMLKAQGGDIVEQLAKQFGLDKSDAEKALSNLIPAVAGGVKKAASSKNSLESLLGKVQANQDMRRSIESPTVLGNPQVTQAGNEVLADIFGSKEVSRTVADQTSKSTGIDFGILKKMLPLVAGLVMSSLSKKGQSSNGGLGELLGGLAGSSQPQRSSGLGSLLGIIFGSSKKQQAPSGGLESFLDFDGDGNIADDVLDLARKLF